MFDAGGCFTTEPQGTGGPLEGPSQIKPACVDLFAGAGGFSLAAYQAGFDIIAAAELNPHACRTYRKNIMFLGNGCNNPKLVEGDLLCERKIKEICDIVIASGKQCDLVLGGPPCQGFSSHRINDSGVNDPRNALIIRYFEIVSTLLPKVFLMENVPGILWKRHSSWLGEFYKFGKKAGYIVYEPIVLDARDFGVPQRRKRVFIFGIRQDVSRDSFIWPPKGTHAKVVVENSGLLPWVSSQVVFDSPAPENDPNDIHMNHSQEIVNVFKSTPINGGSRRDSSRVLPCHEKHDGHKDVYGRISLDQPGPTMTTACINPSKGRFVHPIEHHGITIRQAARFQTFPDQFVFEGGLIAAGMQIGNAVPVRLGKILLEHIAKLLC